MRASGQLFVLFIAALANIAYAAPPLRVQHFDADPNWDANNNRPRERPGKETIQNFGYSTTSHVNDEPGEIGGPLQTAAERAYYAMPLDKVLTFNDHMRVSGKVRMPEKGDHGLVLFGFFNAGNSIGWRNRNSMMMRLDARGDSLNAHVEFCTDRWRAGAGLIGHLTPEERMVLIPISEEGVHTFSLDYDPAGTGTITFTFDNEKAVVPLSEGFRADNAFFDRVGMMNIQKSSDDNVSFYFDEIEINGEKQDFKNDPRWEGIGNRTTFYTTIVRPWFDFGYSPTNFAGGKTGELGGVIFRGDSRYPTTMGYYGDRVGPLSTKLPLEVNGRISMVRGVTDSGAMLGWFNSKSSMEIGEGKVMIPKDFMGVMIEAPSRDGFFLRPVYRMHGDTYGVEVGPFIYPDGAQHHWSLTYKPGADAASPGTMTVVLDENQATLEVPAEALAEGATFDRFGIVTTTIDGNMVVVYFDDLAYTAEQE